MTNEEAIKRLKSDIYKYSDFTENPNENEFWTAFDMAIKALEQEPCEDAISRQAVLDGLASIAKAKAKSDAQKALMGRVMFFTEQLPPVTPLPKGHGDLVDIDEIWHLYDYSNIDYTMIDAVENAPTIIEADKVGEEDASNKSISSKAKG